LNLDVRPKPFFEPPFALARKRVRDHSLGVRDVWEVTETDYHFLLRPYDLQKQRERAENDA
jgi:hypothetical protein